MSAPTAIALSGGVDSLVSAYLLKKAGHDLVGLHFLNGFEPHYIPPEEPPGSRKPALIESPEAAGYAELASGLRKMTASLRMPVLIYDCAVPFRHLVVDYFLETYRKGETPNPCMVCNRRIKFGVMLTAARELGAARLATGHYVRTVQAADGRMHLKKGRDARKDQAYFLARLTQAQLAASCFPLGDRHKAEIVALAEKRGLIPLAKRESQDVCFVGETAYGTFLADTLGVTPTPGDIEDLQGRRIGRHRGLHFFTIGQRRGIDCPSQKPYYVCGLDTDRNVLRVGRRADLLSSSCRLKALNWIVAPPAKQLRVKVRIRYRSPAVAATVIPTGSDTARVEFDAPQSAVTPGQGAVFYQDDEILGGGWITRAE